MPGKESVIPLLKDTNHVNNTASQIKPDGGDVLDGWMGVAGWVQEVVVSDADIANNTLNTFKGEEWGERESER